MPGDFTDASLVSRIEVLSGDFFADALPQADVIVRGNILHDWNEEATAHCKKDPTPFLPSHDDPSRRSR